MAEAQRGSHAGVGPEDLREWHKLSSHHWCVRPEQPGDCLDEFTEVRAHQHAHPTCEHLLLSMIPPARSKNVFGNTPTTPEVAPWPSAAMGPWGGNQACAVQSVQGHIQTHRVLQCRTRCSLATLGRLCHCHVLCVEGRAREAPVHSCVCYPTLFVC